MTRGPARTLVLALALVACAQPPGPSETFSRACAAVGEAMVGVIAGLTYETDLFLFSDGDPL